ncbi:hypothetical protein ACROYT_G016756 [Oculina patagonica]
MSELKKKLKKKVKVRESHRMFVRNTIHEAKDEIDKPEEPNAMKKLKRDNLSELETLDNEIFDLVDDSKIEANVSKSCEFASPIQACIVDLETAIHAKTTERKSHEGQGAILDSQWSTQEMANWVKIKMNEKVMRIRSSTLMVGNPAMISKLDMD